MIDKALVSIENDAEFEAIYAHVLNIFGIRLNLSNDRKACLPPGRIAKAEAEKVRFFCLGFKISRESRLAINKSKTTDDLEKRWAAEAPEMSYKDWLAEQVIKLESVISEARDHLYTAGYGSRAGDGQSRALEKAREIMDKRGPGRPRTRVRKATKPKGLHLTRIGGVGDDSLSFDQYGRVLQMTEILGVSDLVPIGLWDFGRRQVMYYIRNTVIRPL